MTNTVNSSYYQLSLNILKALGGDVSVTYPDADAIWDEIYKIYDHAGGRFDIVPLEKKLTANGNYTYYPDNDADAFMPVSLVIDVPQKYTDEDVVMREEVAREEGYEIGYSRGQLEGREEGYEDGYSGGMTAQKEKLTTIEIKSNGTYSRDDGWNEVSVQVDQGPSDEELQEMLKDAMDEGYQDGYADGVDDGREDGIAEQKEKLESTTITDNGTYTREDGWNSVTVEVDVPTFETETLSVELKTNGNYNYTPTKDGYSSVSVTVDVDTSGGGKPKIYNGFRLHPLGAETTSSSTVDFSQYDWSDVYDLGYFFGGFYATNRFWAPSYFANFIENFNGKLLSGNNMFEVYTGGNPPIHTLPDFGKQITNGCLNLTDLCNGQTNLYSAVNLSGWDLSKVESLGGAFNGCTSLSQIPALDIPNAVNIGNIYRKCKGITNATFLDNRNVMSMSYAFYGCTALTNVTMTGTNNPVDCTAMFSGCDNLTNFTVDGTLRVADAYEMFKGCYKLKEIPSIDTQYCKGFSRMFYTSEAIETIPEMDFSLCSSVSNMFGFLMNYFSLKNVGGFVNLGMQQTIEDIDSFLKYCPLLTRDSMLNIVNKLYDRASYNMNIMTIGFNKDCANLLTDEEKAIAINKGWTLSFT